VLLIKQLLLNEKKVVVSDLSKKFSVTEETIRRDLDKLEAEGFLTRTYGGAVLNAEEIVSNVPFYKRAEHNLQQKQVIAITAQEVLQSAHTIFADASSTVIETLKLLKNRDDLTIVTNSSEALKELIVSDVNILSTGGTLNKRTLSLQGDLTEYATSVYNVDLAVLSCKGIDFHAGVTDTNEIECRIKRKMIEQANEVVLLVDHSKFGKKAFIHLSDFSNVSYIITDQKPSKEWLDFLKNKGIHIYY
jgi:DeoR/GlpR family transcriptional regulator of sugar metabolism